MPRKAPRNAKKAKRPAGANARPGRAAGKGAGVIAVGLFVGLFVLLFKALKEICPSKQQLQSFWANPLARKATLSLASLLVVLGLFAML
ncbi:MAG: hypothetical protein KDB07_07700, partial [Planctomycetes bacterium]|nr:hypothetical protein [Planctomycetota bacterium]